MTRLIAVILAAGLIAAAASCAGNSTGPASPRVETPRVASEVQPVFASNERDEAERPRGAGGVPMPAGHPDIEELMKRQAEAGLPAGHPDISEMMKRQSDASLPAGHPDISATQAQETRTAGGALPEGHPDISQMTAGQKPAAAASTVQPAEIQQSGEACCPTHAAEMGLPAPAPSPSILANINVSVVQGTSGGPPITGGKVTLEIHQSHQPAQSIELELDTNGRASIEELPAPASFQPVAKMVYHGVEYEMVGPAMGAGNPIQDIELEVYETTEEKPDWQIRMRHVMIEPQNGHLQVSEIVALHNPSDRAWIGREIADGRRVSFELPLPAGARQVQMVGGYHACCIREHEGQLVNTMAMLPGTLQYQYVYALPIVEGAADVTVAAPAPTRQVAIFMPDDQTRYALGGGLQDGGTTQMTQGGSVRYFSAGNVPAEARLTLSLSEIVLPKATAAASARSHNNAKLIAGGGAVLVLVLGGLMLFAKGGKKAK